MFTNSIQKTILCGCGSKVVPSSLYRHERTKRHLHFKATGKPKPPYSASEYQRKRFNNNPELREKQRQVCRDYYTKNRTQVREQQTKFRIRKKQLL